MIICSLLLSLYEEYKDEDLFGEELRVKDGFIHCSTLDLFPTVVKKFINIDEPMVLLLLEEKKLSAEVKYEVSKKDNKLYPHIYGLINKEAVKEVLPLLRDENKEFIQNKEFALYR